jgi:hypothetical protein
MYSDPWNALAERIHSLTEALQLHKTHSQDSFGRARHLRRKVEGTLGDLRSFRDRFQYALPPLAITAIDSVLKTTGEKLSMASGQIGLPEIADEAVFTALFELSDFVGEMASILSDVQWPLRALSERAFEHLQRLIVVDEQYRAKWKAALEKDEPECEKLGAVHLLWHGIWAFKVNAEGGRTDLVYQQPTGELVKEQQYADGFVLTEWKIANTDAEAILKCQKAREQAKLYASGVLGGTELTAYRYIVVVSQRSVKVPDPIKDRGVEYRHINIAVEPLSPSRQARRRVRNA